MCGIMFIKNLKDNGRVNDTARVIYENQKHRGSSAFGVVAFNQNEYYVDRWTNEEDFLEVLNGLNYDEVMIHQRFPTSTENRLNSCHPFTIKRAGKIYQFIHNGIISNDDELIKKHRKLKIRYTSYKKGEFNDSEALAWEFVLYLTEGRAIEARGSVALMCLVQDEGTLRAEGLYFYRNTANPITMLKTENTLMLASEGLPQSVEADKLWRFNYTTRQIEDMGELKIATGYAYTSSMGFSTQYDWDDYEWKDKDTFGEKKGKTYSEDVMTYEQAMEVLGYMADEYLNYACSDEQEDINEAIAIKAEAEEIMQTYAIPKGHLKDFGIEFPLIINQDYDEVPTGLEDQALFKG